MAGQEFRIAIDLESLIPVGSALDSSTLPNLSKAVQDITELAYAQWRQYAQGEPMPNGKVIQMRSGAYLKSITLRQTGEFSAEVFSDIDYAASIENGRPAYDMKKMLDSSYKVRITKDGRRYLIIPFRHQTPGAVGTDNTMPAEVHDWWQGKAPSHIVRTGHRLSGTGAYEIHTRERITTPTLKYFWGARLNKDDLADLGITGKAAKQMAGMVNFRQPGASGSKQSGFITFRMMVEGGKGWMAKATEGKHPAQQVSEMFRPIAEEAFKGALAADIERLLPRS